MTIYAFNFFIMMFAEIVNQMKIIQSTLLEFLEDNSDTEDKYQNFIDLATNPQIIEDQYEFKLLLHLISKIESNHQRVHNFISKIEQILKHFKDYLKKYFSNSEIFAIFRSNKRILLFLIQEEIITIDEQIVLRIIREKHAEYFAPEIRPFITEEFIKKHRKYNKYIDNDYFIEEITKEVPKEFYDKRKEGENDDFLCTLIRFDYIEEFVAFVNQANISLHSVIKKSIFETNPFLLKDDDILLIEYAAFFGSNRIIKYMQINGVKLTPSCWYYAIHSNNAELIKELEEKHVSPTFNKYEAVLWESIKCHHNDVSNYIIDNLINKENLHYNNESSFDNYVCHYAIEYHNYYFLPEKMTEKKIFFYLCKFHYYKLVKFYLHNEIIEINAKYIGAPVILMEF